MATLTNCTAGAHTLTDPDAEDAALRCLRRMPLYADKFGGHGLMPAIASTSTSGYGITLICVLGRASVHKWWLTGRVGLSLSQQKLAGGGSGVRLVCSGYSLTSVLDVCA